jgi:hypothetical protein
VEGSCSSRETSGVRRRRSFEEWSSSEGAHRKGADGGDARAVGDKCAGLGRGRMRQTAHGGEKFGRWAAALF